MRFRFVLIWQFCQIATLPATNLKNRSVLIARLIFAMAITPFVIPTFIRKEDETFIDKAFTLLLYGLIAWNDWTFGGTSLVSALCGVLIHVSGPHLQRSCLRISLVIRSQLTILCVITGFALIP